MDPTEVGDPSVAIASKNCVVTDSGALLDRPGLSSFGAIGSYSVDGIAEFGNYLVAVTANRRVYSITSAGAVTDITGSVTLDGTSTPTFTTDGGELVICGGGEPKMWTGSGNTAALTGSPPDISHMVYIDGYYLGLVPADDAIQWAGPTNTLRQTWSAANFFEAEALPDNSAAIADNLGELFVFGSETTERYRDFGDSSVPFRRSAIPVDKGTRSPYSVVKADSTLAFLDSEGSFLQFQGSTPVNVGVPWVDRYVKRLSTITDCRGFRIDIDGSYQILWTFPTEGVGLIYDYKNKTWREWDGLENGVPARFRGACYLYHKAHNKHYVGDYRQGRVWQMSREFHADGDNPRKVLHTSGYIDFGTAKRKRNLYYDFHVKRGVGASGAREPRFEVSYRDDGGQWTDPQEITLGTIGDNRHVVRLHNQGIYTKRQIAISMTDNAEFTLSRIDDEVEVLAS